MLTLAIFVPLAGAVALLLLPRDRPALARGVAVGTAAVPMALLIAAWTRFEIRPGYQWVEAIDWIPSLGVRYAVAVDGISLPLATMAALLFLASVAWPAEPEGRSREYYALFLFLETASLGVFLAADLFLFYVFWDLSLVGMYFLIAAWGHGEDPRRSALKFFLYTLAGSLAMLLAILGLYLSTEPRTFDMAAIAATRPLAAGGPLAVLVFAGFALGFAIKTPLVPFHTWLPPAHVDAPAPASTILAGVLLKMGTYGFVRILMQMMPGTFRRFAWPLAIVAVVSILYGALVALAQKDLKRRIAYTSVNHMGYTILGIAAAGSLFAGLESARELALTGAVVEMVAHGLITGALFLMTGAFWRRAHTYEIDAFGGLARHAPWLTGFFALAAFASMGLPGLAGFVAEFQIFVGAFGPVPWLAGIGLLGILVTAALFLHLMQAVFLGEAPDRWAGWSDLSGAEIAALAGLLVFVVAIGVAPAWLLEVVGTASKSIVALFGPAG